MVQTRQSSNNSPDSPKPIARVINSIGLANLENTPQGLATDEDLRALIQRALWDVFNAGNEKSALAVNSILSCLKTRTRNRLFTACGIGLSDGQRFSFKKEAAARWDTYYTENFLCYSTWDPAVRNSPAAIKETASPQPPQFHF